MMKIDEERFLSDVENALRSCLQKVTFLKIENVSRGVAEHDSGVDLIMNVRVGQKLQRLAIDAKSNGQPRVARNAVYHLNRIYGGLSDVYCIFAAPYISPQAAEICNREGVGYLDLAGNCHLNFKGVYIEQGGKPNPFSEKRYLRSLYSPKAARVLGVLLNNPRVPWKVQALADEAKVSLGQVSNVKTLLENREWLITSNEGFLLSKPEEILIEWSNNYSFKKNEAKNYYSLKSPAEIEAELAEICERENFTYALTGFSGGARYAPNVRYQRAMAYVEAGLGEISSCLSLKEVSSGANITLAIPYDEGVFYGSRLIDEIQVASPVQVYLDLISIKGRGEEAASSILEKVINQTW